MHRGTKTVIGVAAITAFGLMLAGCAAAGGDESGSDATTLTLGSTNTPQSWDPALVGDSNFVPYAQAAYDSLIRRTVDDEYVPMLATAWEFSNENKTVTLTLRDDVTFSDGEVFNAEAVKANVEHFAQSAGPLGNQLVGLSSAEVLGDYEIALSFDAAIPDLLYNLSDAAGRMASPAAIGTDGLKTVPVGTGPYVMNVDDTVQGSTYTLEAREDYWAEDLQKYDEVIFQIFPQETGLLNALKSGQVDAGNLSTQDNIQNAKSTEGIEVLNPDVHISWAGLAIYDRAGTIVPELAKKEVRQAIAHAIDTEGILEAAFAGEGQPNTQIFNEASSAYDDALNDAFAYDPELAQQLMDEAGVAGFTLPLPLVPDFVLPAIQASLEQNLGEIGISIEWINTPLAALYGDMAAGKFAASYVFFGSTPTDWSVVQSYMAPAASWNPFQVSDPELQALIDSIPAGTDEDREAAYRAINDWEIENVWFDPWFWVEENYAVRPDAVTVELQPKNNVPFIYNYSPAS